MTNDADPSALPTANQRFTLLICTANRSQDLGIALDSLVKVGVAGNEVVIVDQSRDDTTESVVSRYRTLLPIHYLRSPTQGKCIAANIGLKVIETEFVVMVDDDCEVTPGWTDALIDAMAQDEKVAVVYGSVAAAFERPGGFIPTYIVPRETLVTNWIQKCRARGIGANCAFRKSLIEGIGGFNEDFGPGSKFRSCSDGELSLRCLANGLRLRETPASTVLHYGFRSDDDGRTLAYNAFYGIAACCLQTVFKGSPGAWIVLLYEVGLFALWPAFVSVVRLRPRGLARVAGFLAGSRAIIAHTYGRQPKPK